MQNTNQEITEIVYKCKHGKEHSQIVACSCVDDLFLEEMHFPSFKNEGDYANSIYNLKEQH